METKNCKKIEKYHCQFYNSLTCEIVSVDLYKDDVMDILNFLDHWVQVRQAAATKEIENDLSKEDLTLW